MVNWFPIITFLLFFHSHNELNNNELALSNSFDTAWEDPQRPIIIDAYGPNRIDWEEMMQDKRVVGIIHKASEGFKKHLSYEGRMAKAKALGYKWGAYHLGKAGNPVEQADFYLQSIHYTGEELLALDLETVGGKKYMSLPEAELFIQRIHQKTGKYPLLYCNHLVLQAIANNYDANSLFAKCPLWYARFRTDITNFENPVWPSYTLWQFSCEINCKQTGSCLYNVPGTEFDMDVNVYNGSIGELKEKWPDL